MEINERKRKILAAIIDDFVETAEPVGSRTIAQKAGLGLSSATIRNEMAELTALGYLEQPHTSAGRVPSHMGYRLYVNELMKRHRLSVQETDSINREFHARLQQLDLLLSDIGLLAARLTKYPALTLRPPSKASISRFELIFIDANTFIIVLMLSDNTIKNKLIHLTVPIDKELLVRLTTAFNAHMIGITEDQISRLTVMSIEQAAGDNSGISAAIASFTIEALSEAAMGEAHITDVSRLLDQPEYKDPDKARRLLIFLTDSEKLLSLPISPSDGNIKVMIGPENTVEELRDSSVIVASYEVPGASGIVGVIGPTRMDYPRVAARLKYFAEGLSRVLRGAAPLPAGPGDEGNKGDEKIDESG